MERKSQGYKVCEGVADDLRRDVADALKMFGRVPLGLVEIMRKTAFKDAQIHKNYGPDFGDTRPRRRN